MTAEKQHELQQALRRLPAVNDVLAAASIREAVDGLPHEIVVQCVRETISDCRSRAVALFNGGDRGSLDSVLGVESVTMNCRRRIDALRTPNLTAAINATGIIIHTGMGRSPIAEEALQAVAETSRSYSDVAIGKADGGRRNRSSIVADLLKVLTGCEAALVTNNNAAAILLGLATHAKDKEVIVSRGQLVEIGGSFRLPEVMEGAGARLREVGTTNRTRLSDYENAIGEDTAALMRIHPSNFRIVGFTESVEIDALVALGRRRNLLVLDDIGSGALVDFSPFGLKGETTASQSVLAGADMAFFSGDKLLGGPQAGVIVGRKDPIAACARNPLMRALRVDKMTMAALEATLRLYLEPATLTERLPLLRMISEPPAGVRRRARRLATILKRSLPSLQTEVVPDVAYVGGGSLPDESLDSWVVVLSALPVSVEEFKCGLRVGDPSVFSRTRQDRVELDMRTVADAEIAPLADAIARQLKKAGA